MTVSRSVPILKALSHAPVVMAMRLSATERAVLVCTCPNNSGRLL